MPVSSLATVDAALNATAAVLLSLGFFFIRRRQIERHRLCMLSAFGVSVAFLVTYLVHHAQVGSVPYRGQGIARMVYFAILIPHVVLAAAVVPLALTTLGRALKGRFELHKRIARWTLPIWLYVSVSGVVVYWMLYGP
jgi:putative membrane protein